MKKIFAIGLAAALSLTLLAGCGGGNNNNNNNNNNGGNKNNTKPTIEGVQDAVTLEFGEEFDALSGVTASDKEDGNLTSKIVVTSYPELTFENGKTTPAESGTYDLTYTVKDSGGLEAMEFCTLTVNPELTTVENVYTADFSEVTPKYDYAEGAEGEGDNHWWTPTVDTAEGKAELKNGAFVFDVTDLKDAPDGDVRLSRTFNDLEPGTYKFVVWASSTADTYIHLIAKDNLAADWQTPGGKWNVKVTSKVAAYSTDDFELQEGGTTSLEFRIHMGKITPDGEHPEDTSANAFSLAIEKIAIYKTTGVDREVDILNKGQFEDKAGLEITNQGDGAVVAAEYDETAHAAKINVSTYNTTGGIWSISAMLPLTGVTIQKDVRYGYEVVMSATAALGSEMIISTQDNKEDSGREINYGANIGTEDTTITGVYTAKADYDTPAIHWQLGKKYDGGASPDVASNVILIKSVRFFKVEGDKKTDKFQDKFMTFGKASHDNANAKYPFDVFNASDDDPANKGIGTAYLENGKLVYKIHEAGTDGGNNKLAIGYWENPIELPANAYYVITLKIKASVDLSFNLTLHDMNHAWGDPVDEGVLFRRASWLNNAVQAGTTEQTLEFITEAPSVEATKCELLLEFGSAELAKLTGDVTIEISELTIGVRKLAN